MEYTGVNEGRRDTDGLAVLDWLGTEDAEGLGVIDVNVVGEYATVGTEVNEPIGLAVFTGV